jgi:hypothetical protein
MATPNASVPSAWPSQPSAIDASVPPPPAAPAPILRLSEVAQVLAAPVVSLALDPKRGQVAALGAQPWLFDGSRWLPIPLPSPLHPQAGEHDEVRIHFGRDSQPRIMGNRFGADGSRQLYLRFRHGGWREEPKELASFAGKPRAAIYGVLGWDDPEVVCKVGELCLVKQRSGWSQAPLPVPGPTMALRIDLGLGGVYALLPRQLLRLDQGGWVAVGGSGAWQHPPGGAWLHRAGGWVSVPEEDALYHYDGRSWRRHPSPVHEPRGLWAGSEQELWIAGSDGAGYYDGERFWRVEGVAGPVAEIVGRADRLWFGGAGGVWAAKRATSH